MARTTLRAWTRPETSAVRWARSEAWRSSTAHQVALHIGFADLSAGLADVDPSGPLCALVAEREIGARDERLDVGLPTAGSSPGIFHGETTGVELGGEERWREAHEERRLGGVGFEAAPKQRGAAQRGERIAPGAAILRHLDARGDRRLLGFGPGAGVEDARLQAYHGGVGRDGVRLEMCVSGEGRTREARAADVADPFARLGEDLAGDGAARREGEIGVDGRLADER